MFHVFFILILIGLIISFSISIISSIYIILNRKDYGVTTIAVLNLISINFIGILFSLFFFLSTQVMISRNTNLILFYFTLIFETTALLIYCLDFSFLKQFGDFPVYIFLMFIITISLLIGILNSPESIYIEFMEDNKLKYTFASLPQFLIIAMNISGILYIIFKAYQILKVSDLIQFCWRFVFLVGILSFSVVFFCFYIISTLIILRELFILIFWVAFALKCYITITNAKQFIALTNKIYFINIYHKTGVLLYSYKFEQSAPEEGESAIWGNILIGLNHILSEFINEEDQIDVLQTKNAEIIVNYNNEYGFAVLVITNQKNSLIEKNMENLETDFAQKYQKELSELQDINRIINVSNFKDADNIVRKHFKLFL